MYIRELKRKTTQNIAVQIVESYRNRNGQPRVRIIQHMGSVRPEAVDGLVKIAYLELAQIQKERQPSLFPAESYVEEVVEARRNRRESRALVIQDARKLEEVRRICLGFREVIGALYDQMRFADVFGARQQMARRLFKQAEVWLFLGRVNWPMPDRCRSRLGWTSFVVRQRSPMIELRS